MFRILVVEDSPTLLQLSSTILTQGGYEVLKATNGDEALRLAVEEQPHLVLLDVILPRLNGYQVCRQIKSLPETMHIPVVIITSKTKTSDRLWGFEQGADGYITKPLSQAGLLGVIERFVPHHGSEMSHGNQASA